MSWRLAVTLLMLGMMLALPASAATRRFAVVVGNNAGSGARPPLRFAENDAGKIARVLQELGDVDAKNLMLVQGRGVSQVEQAFAQIKARVQSNRSEPDSRALVFFYYSGHSDGEALELGSERLSFSRLRSMLSGAGAELRVVVIDACRSGAALSVKGGTLAPAFTIRLNDELTATGEVFITSSAADEAALESEELMGSFFTHNFVSGLRGAADVSGDKLITLSEAYQYAHDRTLAATAVLGSGQHPLYDYRLSGQGELVLSSLHRSPAMLELPTGADRILVTDLLRDQVVAEASVGSARQIALPPGSFAVRLLRGGDAFGGRYTLVAGTRQQVRWEDLSKVPTSSQHYAMKGSGSEVSRSLSSQNKEDSATLRWFMLSGGAGGAISRDITLSSRVRLAVEPSVGRGLTLALVGGFGTSSDSQLREHAAGVRVGYRFLWDVGPVAFLVGAELGPEVLWQTQVGAPTASTLAATAAARAGVRLHIYKPLWLTLEGELPASMLRLDDSLQVKVLPGVTAGLAAAF